MTSRFNPLALVCFVCLTGLAAWVAGCATGHGGSATVIVEGGDDDAGNGDVGGDFTGTFTGTLQFEGEPVAGRCSCDDSDAEECTVLDDGRIVGSAFVRMRVTVSGNSITLQFLEPASAAETPITASIDANGNFSAPLQTGDVVPECGSRTMVFAGTLHASVAPRTLSLRFDVTDNCCSMSGEGTLTEGT